MKTSQYLLILLGSFFLTNVFAQSKSSRKVKLPERVISIDFDKTEKFYKFADINQANQDSVSGKTIKPVLVIDEDYQPE